RYFFRIRDSRLPRLFAEIGEAVDAPIPESSEFRAYLLQLAGRAEARQERDRFQALIDVPAAELVSEGLALAEKLYPHQRVAVKWLLENKRAFLGDDMGLGKTLSVLACFEWIAQLGQADFLFVVCPNSLCRNWRREAEHWLPGRNLALLPGE